MAGIVIAAVLVVVVLTITIAGGTFLPRHYLDPWKKDYYQRFDDPRMQLVAHGILAANSHNMQPFVLILTDDSSRTSQVRAGMAYARMQLTAQSMGLAVQPLSQILEEYPEMDALRAQVHARYAPNGETIQMLARVGVPTRDVPLSMRRDAEDLVVK